MIDDLDRSIRALLRRDIRDMGISNLTVSFETPDAQFRPRVEPPTINFFLYDVRENLTLRSNERWIEPISHNRVRAQPAVVRVDCAYLVTAWVGDGANRAEEEHQLLGSAMRVLLTYPKLPAEILQGQLRGQEPPLPTAVLQPGRLPSIGEFWQALGGNPKAALDYSVTIGIQPFADLEGGIVEEVILDIGDRALVPPPSARRILHAKPAEAGAPAPQPTVNVQRPRSRGQRARQGET
jgi:hypothetical protein